MSYSTFAIACITLIELIALEKGFNGTLLRLAISSIAGIAGYKIAQWKEGRRNNGLDGE